MGTLQWRADGRARAAETVITQQGLGVKGRRVIAHGAHLSKSGTHMASTTFEVWRAFPATALLAVCSVGAITRGAICCLINTRGHLNSAITAFMDPLKFQETPPLASLTSPHHLISSLITVMAGQVLFAGWIFCVCAGAGSHASAARRAAGMP